MSLDVSHVGRRVLAIQLIVVAGLLVASPFAPASAQPALGSWSTPVQISSTTLDAGELWQDTVYEYGWANLAISDDNGASWNPEIPFVGAIDVVDYVLHRVNGSSSGDLLYSRSTDNGTTWTDPVFVMANTGHDGFYDIEAIEDVLIVFGWTWGYAIAVSRSVDGGMTWSPRELVDPAVYMTDPEQNDIVYFNGKVYIAYSNETGLPPPSDLRVVLMESSDLGQTWGDRREVCDGRDPQIRSDGGTLYMTYWSDVGLYSVLCFTKSLDGDAWEPATVVARPVMYTDPSGHHTLAVLGGRIFVGYMLYEQIGLDNYYWTHINYSGDDGSTWEDLGDVTGGDGGEMYPNLMVTPTTLHLTWVDNMGSGGWGGVTFYRSLTFDEPIPEFGAMLVPIVGIASIIVAASVLSRRRA